MGVLEDVVMKAKTAADYAGKKTGEVFEITKLRVSASEVETKIGKEYLELGKKVYGAAKDQSDVSEFIAGKVESIDRLDAELEGINAKIAALRNEKKCAACGFNNPQDANFCQKCGAQL